MIGKLFCPKFQNRESIFPDDSIQQLLFVILLEAYYYGNETGKILTQPFILQLLSLVCA